MYVRLNGEMVYLWRAVDHEGEVLESYVTRTRDKDAALRFMKKALKRHGSPEAITTDGLRSYGAAMGELGCREKQEVGRWANNRVENSHLPFRRRERAMLRFRQMKSLQKLSSTCSSPSTAPASSPATSWSTRPIDERHGSSWNTCWKSCPTASTRSLPTTASSSPSSPATGTPPGRAGCAST